MAITTTTFSKSVGWARTDVIAQLESAFSYLGWHGGALSGIVTGIVGIQTGGNYGSGIATYHTNVIPSSTSGIGTGVSFDIYRSGGLINQIYINRPGAGYTDGEVVQIPASAIGGTVNGAVAIALTVKVAGNASPIGFGTTSAFFTKDNSGTYPWGVMRHTIQANKKYGDIYRAFQVNSSANLRIFTGPFFHPGGIADNVNNLGMGYTNTFRGDQLLDTPDSSYPLGNTVSTQASSSSDNYGTYNLDGNLNYASSNSYRLDLNLYRSGIDQKFVVFSYAQPTLSSTKLTDNTFDTFIFHNFNSTLWDYDNVFLSGMTKVIPNTNTNVPSITFRTYTASHYYTTTSLIAKRSAEIGYMSPDTGGSYSSVHYVDYYIESNTYDQRHDNYYNTARIYYRNTTNTRRSTGGYNGQNSADPNANFNAVIKGIPLNGNMIPIPYYIPDDFVLIDFDYASPSANIQQGDTITISGSEVYTVITGSYNQTTRTRGILFCGRKV
jgi:hypothetical protein